MSAPESPAAFPCAPGDVPYWNEGMSLRDWFAGQALAGFMATPPFALEEGQTLADARLMVAGHIYGWADAMLAAREQKA